eukprot:3396256-Rhodomonas_salina.2
MGTDASTVEEEREKSALSRSGRPDDGKPPSGNEEDQAGCNAAKSSTKSEDSEQDQLGSISSTAFRIGCAMFGTDIGLVPLWRSADRTR